MIRVVEGFWGGPIEIESVLGEGASATVYAGRFVERPDQRYAFKIFSEAHRDDREMRRRLLREVRILSGIQHSNVVKLHGFVESRDDVLLVLELLEGETLRSRLVHGGVSEREALSYTLDAASGLEAIHAAGVVHRDIKPENLFVTKTGGIKVLDFGLAGWLPPILRSAQSRSRTRDTAPGTLIGTLDYMSPEQLRSTPLAASSDIFGLGVVLWEMLMGVHPFRHDSCADTIAAILKDEPLAPMGRARSSGPLALARRMLSRSPSERPTAWTVRRDLERLLNWNCPKKMLPSRPVSGLTPLDSSESRNQTDGRVRWRTETSSRERNCSKNRWRTFKGSSTSLPGAIASIRPRERNLHPTWRSSSSRMTIGG
jgi:serine/threonine protein kinase